MSGDPVYMRNKRHMSDGLGEDIPGMVMSTTNLTYTSLDISPFTLRYGHEVPLRRCHSSQHPYRLEHRVRSNLDRSRSCRLPITRRAARLMPSHSLLSQPIPTRRISSHSAFLLHNDRSSLMFPQAPSALKIHSILSAFFPILCSPRIRIHHLPFRPIPKLSLSNVIDRLHRPHPSIRFFSSQTLPEGDSEAPQIGLEGESPAGEGVNDFG